MCTQTLRVASTRYCTLDIGAFRVDCFIERLDRAPSDGRRRGHSRETVIARCDNRPRHMPRHGFRSAQNSALKCRRAHGGRKSAQCSPVDSGRDQTLVSRVPRREGQSVCDALQHVLAVSVTQACSINPTGHGMTVTSIFQPVQVPRTGLHCSIRLQCEIIRGTTASNGCLLSIATQRRST
jgi:hypothetical protein